MPTKECISLFFLFFSFIVFFFFCLLAATQLNSEVTNSYMISDSLKNILFQNISLINSMYSVTRCIKEPLERIMSNTKRHASLGFPRDMRKDAQRWLGKFPLNYANMS